ncbi:MAG: AlkZ family DNA glycosylase [Actinobacteria bacterium]|nr:AlkZ family DNA glycosylase [Actinomycetota bacterium]
MTTEAVARWRLRSLLLTPPQRSSAAAVATHFGAMQAQDLASGLWSFGSRLPELSREDICTQVNRRELLRTWTQRGTLHFVAAQDARWLLATCGRRHHRRSRRQQLGITDAQADRAAEILQDSLCGNRSLSRREVAQLLQERGVDATGQRLYHLLLHTALSGLTCYGPIVDDEQSIVLLAEWAPQQREFTGDAALGELARRYFRSHGPASRADFAHWAGFGHRDAGVGIAVAAAGLKTVECDGRELLLDPATEAGPATGHVNVVAPYDEFLLGYADRSAAVAEDKTGAVMPGGGVFRAIVVRDGVAFGTWRRSVREDFVSVEVSLLWTPDSQTLDRMECAFERYGAFLNRTVRLRIR